LKSDSRRSVGTNVRLVLVVVVTLVAGCGSSGKSVKSSPTSNPCAQDTVGRSTPHAYLQVPRGTKNEVTATQSMPCASSVYVVGNGQGNLLFGTTARCSLVAASSTTEARAVNRDPPTVLLRVAAGKAQCSSRETVSMPCANGAVIVTGAPAQFILHCQPDPQFEVDVYSGSLRIVDPEKHEAALDDADHSRLTFDFATGTATVDRAEFSESEKLAFAAQAQELGIPFTPPTPPTTSPNLVTVPNTLGLDATLAARQLIDVGFLVQELAEPSSTVPKGLVIRTDPRPGDTARPGSTVNIYVSSGQSDVVVPDVRGLAEGDAEATLKGVGLVANPVGQPSTPENFGKVLNSDPAPGTMVSPGQTVVILIGTSDTTTTTLPTTTT